MNNTASVEVNRCNECGTEIEESASVPLDARVPCPSCGSTNRNISLSAHTIMTMTASADAHVIPYPTILLGESRELYSAGKYGVSVLVAHMACEVAVERVIACAFEQSTFQHMADPMLKFLNGYNLANERIRGFYTALTDDDVTCLAEWKAFKASAERRNRVAHAGKIVLQQEAEETLTATSALVKHLGFV
ncbi:putative RNA-binding Zn-ribbon protein involved in translation (DUF1610 family) [Paraburkholderia atlantica]|uniref:FmdB family zinc ribbon protein n=1 Tax=Paraburkholderia atlantica TaxID=2654982 RepID=UPI003D25A657